MKYKKSQNIFFKKPLFAQIMLLVVLIGIIYFLKPSLDLSGGNTPNLATLVISFETEKRAFEGEVVKDMTMLDSLNMATSVGKIKLKYVVDAKNSVNIVEIDGHQNGDYNRYFAFYVNFEKIDPVKLNETKIRGGDKVEVTFQ